MIKIIFTALYLTALLHYTHAQEFRNGMIAASPGATNKDGVYYYAGLDEKPDFPDRENGFVKQIADKVNTEPYKDKPPGTVLNIVLSFIIEKDGSVTHTKVVNDNAPATNKEAIKATSKEVIDAVKAIKTKWIPGKYKAKKIRTGMEMSIHIPIYKGNWPHREPDMDNVKIVEEIPFSGYDRGIEPDSPKDEENAVFAAAGLQVSPEFPGGIKALQTSINDNINKEKLPAGTGAKDLKVFTSFVVEQDGTITGIKILRDPGYGMGKETERVLKLLTTKWKPGIQNGKPVRTQYNLPVVIKLPE